MRREELSNMQEALDMFEAVLGVVEHRPGVPSDVDMVALLNAQAGVQVALLAEISDKLTALSVQLGRK